MRYANASLRTKRSDEGGREESAASVHESAATCSRRSAAYADDSTAAKASVKWKATSSALAGSANGRRAQRFAEQREQQPEQAERAREDARVDQPGSERGGAFGGGVDGDQARGADAAGEVELDVGRERAEREVEDPGHERRGEAEPELDRGVSFGPAASQQDEREQRDREGQRRRVRFDGGAADERAEQQLRPAMLRVDRDPDRAERERHADGDAARERAFELPARREHGRERAGQRERRRETRRAERRRERAMDQSESDGARQGEAERADPTGAQQSTTERQQREQLGERGGDQAFAAAGHEPERAHGRQVVAPLAGRRSAQHGDDERHRERQLARGRLPKQRRGDGPVDGGISCWWSAHRPWLPDCAKKAQFSDKGGKTADPGGLRRRPAPQIQGKSSGP